MRRLLLVLAFGFIVVASDLAVSGDAPSVRVTDDADGATVLNPFPDGDLSDTVAYVHVGTDSDTPSLSRC